MTSCTILNFSSPLQGISKIQQGQTPEEVVDIMKQTPNYRRFGDDGLEEWEYRKTYSTNEDHVILINFHNGRVVSMNSFRDIKPLAPQIEQKVTTSE